MNLQPILKEVGRVRRIQRWGDRKDSGGAKVNSQGVCYHLTSHQPSSRARYFLVGSLKPHKGHGLEIRALYGSAPPPRQPLRLILPPPKDA